MLEKIKAKNQIDSKGAYSVVYFWDFFRCLKISFTDEIYGVFAAVEKELKAAGGELDKDSITKALNAAAKSIKANKSFVFLSIR